MGENKTTTKTSIGRLSVLTAVVVGLVAGAVKFAESLKKLLLGDEYGWLFYFLPDMIVLAGLLMFGMFLLGALKYDIPRSLMWVVRHGKLRLVALMFVLLGVGLVLTIPLLARVLDFYRARLFFAKFDWNYHAARGALARDCSAEAIAEFRAQGDRYRYLNKTFRPRQNEEEQDATTRQRDAELLVQRESRLSGQGPTIVRWLMVQRARVLCADCPKVMVAVKEARASLALAVDAYLAGIDRLRQRDWDGARTKLAESKKYCDGLLHQTLLLAYAQSRGSSSTGIEERPIIEYYLTSSSAERKHAVRRHPLIAWAF